MQQERERHGGEQLADLPDGSHRLGQEGKDPAAEPPRHEPADGDEHHRVASTDEDAPDDRDPDARGEREHHLSDRHEEGAAENQLSRTHAVEHDADGNLESRVDDDLHDREARECRRLHVKALGGVNAGNAERRTLHDPDEIGEGADRHDQPGASRVH